MIEAMKQALDWFKCYKDKSMSLNNAEALADEVIEQLEKAIATEESSATQEPCGEAYLCDACQTPFDGAFQCPACGNGRATKEPVYTHPRPKSEQQPISDVTEAVTKTVIEVEKLLCEKLGKPWKAAGMSIQTLVDELAQPKAEQEPKREPLTEEYLRPHYQGQEWLEGVRFAEAAHGIKGEA